MKFSFTVILLISSLLIFSFFPDSKVYAKEIVKKQERIYVTVPVLKVRKEPNLTADTIGKLEKGDSFVVLEEGGDQTTVEGITANWARVSLKGIKGWVFLGFTSSHPPELLSEKEIAKIASKYKRDVDKCEREEEKAMAADPEYQNCSSCGCNLQTSESANIDRGCKPYKLKEIADLARKNGNSNVVPDDEIFVAYNDKYCLDARSQYSGDCSGLKLNLYQAFKD